MAGKTITAIGFEPDLHEVIEDPIIKLLMKKDGVKKEMLLEVIESARQLRPFVAVLPGKNVESLA